MSVADLPGPRPAADRLTHSWSGTRPTGTQGAGGSPADVRGGDLIYPGRTSLPAGGNGEGPPVEQVDGQHLRVGDRWLVDFEGGGHLGLDADPELLEAVLRASRDWGLTTRRAPLSAPGRLHRDVEERLAAVLRMPSVMVVPSIAELHLAAVPAIVGQGWVFVDDQVHRTLYEAAQISRAAGATLRRFRTGDLHTLDRLLRSATAHAPRLICTAGVDGVTGEVPDLSGLVHLAREHGALLYVDDPHGFGLVGDRLPGDWLPYGRSGNGLVRHLGLDYEGLLLAGEFSPSFATSLAFLAAPARLRDHLEIAAGPSLSRIRLSTPALAAAQAGMEINTRRGDAIRERLYRSTVRVLEVGHEAGLVRAGASGLPLVHIPLPDDHTAGATEAATSSAAQVAALARLGAVDLASAAQLCAMVDHLRKAGIRVGLTAYPAPPLHEAGLRIRITASHTEEDLELLCSALAGLAERLPTRPVRVGAALG